MGTGEWDAIVIGSGLGGLTAAAYLAANGRRTVVLEQHYVAGGNAHVFRRKRMFEFDVGVHYIGDCGPGGAIPTVLRGVGLDGAIEFLEMDPDGFDTIVYPGLTFRMPKGWDRYRERLVAAFPDDETGLHRCLDVFERVLAEMRALQEPGAAQDLPRLLREAPTLVTWGGSTLAQLFDECGLGQKARAVILAQSGAYAVAPSRAPVVLHAGMLDHYLRGAYYPKGGGQVLPAHLVDVVRAYGGEVRLRTRVERILVEDGRAAGVRLTTGEELRAPVVISNADVKRTMLDLLGREHLSAAAVKRIESYRMALPVFCVYLGLDTDLRARMPNTNYWYSDSFDVEQAYQDCYAGRMPAAPPLFITTASVKDPTTGRIAPPGHSSIEIMTWVPADYTLWQVEAGARGRREVPQQARLPVVQRAPHRGDDRRRGAGPAGPARAHRLERGGDARDAGALHALDRRHVVRHRVRAGPVRAEQAGPGDGSAGAVPDRREHGIRPRHRRRDARRRRHGERGPGPRPHARGRAGARLRGPGAARGRRPGLGSLAVQPLTPVVRRPAR